MFYSPCSTVSILVTPVRHVTPPVKFAARSMNWAAAGFVFSCGRAVLSKLNIWLNQIHWYLDLYIILSNITYNIIILWISVPENHKKINNIPSSSPRQPLFPLRSLVKKENLKLKYLWSRDRKYYCHVTREIFITWRWFFFPRPVLFLNSCIFKYRLLCFMKKNREKSRRIQKARAQPCTFSYLV